jgi:hypothetical protein
VFLFGAFRVYQKINLGEDMLKPVFIWFGSAILAAMMGYFVSIYFV